MIETFAAEGAIHYARSRFGGPVALMGSSFGGIISWYALTREPDVEAVVCHNIAHPGVLHEPSMRFKVPALVRLARVAPLAGVGIKRLANFEKVAHAPEILDYFRREIDAIWCWKITARSAASLFTYRSQIDWSQVYTPVCVLVGEDDQMVSPAFTEQVVRKGRPPNVDVRILPGLGHLLYHDHLAASLPPTVEWLHRALEFSSPPASKTKERAAV